MNSKPVKLRLKIDLVSYPARVEGLGKYDKSIATMIKLHEWHFQTRLILQIWPPVTTGCLQTSKKCPKERDLTPMKKRYRKLRCILRPKTNRST